ncbi:hypothetical protein JDS91_35945, partial [Bacillus cereus]|nr:hypothetical protein [Bacillus cereus]
GSEMCIRDRKRPDYEVSINTHELNQFVTDIRNIKKAMGVPIKRRHTDDANFILTRRSLVACSDMTKGTNCLLYTSDAAD